MFSLQPKIETPQKKLICHRCVEEEDKKKLKELKEQKKQLKQQKILVNGTNARKSIIKPEKDPIVKEPVNLHRKLPYEVRYFPIVGLFVTKFKLDLQSSNLTWDSAHRTNHEQKYCYCGETGQWFFKMIQCLRCKQWFHEKCVKSLTHPLFYGDTYVATWFTLSTHIHNFFYRFYAFVCENCNEGKEFVRRMELNWIDLVHISMYNLTLVSIKKYHDIDTVISHFIVENWENFNLPDKVICWNDFSP